MVKDDRHLMHFRTVRVWALFILLFFAFACAGKRLTPLKDDAPLPPELAQVEDQFAVKDVTTAPASAVVVVPVPEKQTKVKKEPPKKKAPTEPAPFAFLERRPLIDPLWKDERHVFDVTYLGLSAGEFTIDVLPNKVVNQREVYHIKGSVKSSAVFSMFYRFDDYIETFWDFRGLFSHRFHLVQDESKQYRDSLELFDSEKKQTFFWNRLNHKEKGYSEGKETKEMTPFPQDLLSSLIFMRTLNYKEKGPFKFPVVSEGKNYEGVVHIVRRETVSTPCGKYNAIVLKPQAYLNGELQNKSDSFMWFSDDDRRLMLRLEAKLKVGSMSAVCKSLVPGEPRL